MGLASTPSNMILLSLALFMTFYVMSPTFDQAWQSGVQPLLTNQINEQEAVQRIAEPFRTFMAANTRDKDLALFVDLARERGQTVHDGCTDRLPRSHSGFYDFGDQARDLRSAS